ncbi:DUF2637 domain-containing protein [Nonomuraea sp. NPDC050328]|uniref:DUF2637 domain-containing protein n=1 Tax=Nonomuraea sp. NPDC050328 TaxID=3364361 RepID=UPI0037A323B9
MTSRAERTESAVQLMILLLVGLMAGAASFTHVHDWTMANSPQGTGEWFGWANAVISELTPTASALEVRRRKRHGHSTAYPMTVLIASAVLSIAAQIAVAQPHPTGWLIAAIPALAFLALTKLVLSRTPTAEPAAEAVPEIRPEPAEISPADDGQDERTHQAPAPAMPVLNLSIPALEGQR